MKAKKQNMKQDKKKYSPPAVKKSGMTEGVVIGAIHKGCNSSSSRSKKG